ncbi:hypothetical protein L207DRAFT_562079 [Hyaloscypha variabilis F]|uniref:Uncharacterized protein n=1 Tax=Hyaloscypha variabilis (strain UAMH 11265 / GT02V1 / F) TaxID=1149755 RepID=A0A2J6S7V1_HYAVF|nr:hypothetical protein L207DRAFT_562079 [Hyaloscypha variabilis F]
MPPRTRTGIRPPTTSAINGIENTIQKTHDLVASTDPASIKQLWKELCQKYLDARRIGLTQETFPYWILHNIPDEAIQQMIDVVYGKGARKIESYAPALCKRFGRPQWQFVLFFGHLPQNKVVALNAVTRERTDITFDSLYRELCRIRSKKETLPDGPFNFTPAEIKSCFQDSNSGDEHEGISDDDYQSGDETDYEYEIGIIHVTSSSEGDYDRDSEHNNEDDFDDVLDSPVNDHLSPESSRSEDDYDRDSEHNNEDDFDDVFGSPVNDNLSPESSSSVTDVPDKHVASPIHANSSTSMANPAAHTTNTRRSATDDTVNLIARQLDQGRGRQALASEVLGAGRLPDHEPIADTIVTSDRTVVDTQGETTCTNSITNQRLVDLRNTANLLLNTIDSLWTIDEELKKDQVAILREEAEILEDRKAEAQSFKLLVDSKLTPEVDEAGKAKWSRLVALDKKHDIVEKTRQEYQAKRLKLDTDVKEFSIEGFMKTRERVLE